jgi:pyruvate formate lyase activating enzyme
MSTGIVFDIRKYSIHDGPGIRTAVFLKGCPLRCAWCHNPEGLSAAPELLLRPERCLRCGSCVRACPLGLDPRKAAVSALPGPHCEPRCSACPSFGACAEACPAEALQLVGRRMGVDEVMAAIRADLPFYEESGGGATFTGGEPLAQGEFLLELLRACRREGIHCALDTSGWAAQELLLEAGLLADLVLFDLKSMDEGRHSRATGVPNGPVLANLRALAAAGGNIALRLPLVPGVNDSPADLEAAARYAASLGPLGSIHLLPYHDSGRGKYALRGESYPLDGLLAAAPGGGSPGAAERAANGTAALPEAARGAALEALRIFEGFGLSAIIGG